MVIKKGSRLSVQPVSKDEYDIVVRLGRSAKSVRHHTATARPAGSTLVGKKSFALGPWPPQRRVSCTSIASYSMLNERTTGANPSLEKFIAIGAQVPLRFCGAIQVTNSPRESVSVPIVTLYRNCCARECLPGAADHFKYRP